MPVNRDCPHHIYGSVSISYTQGGFNIYGAQLTAGYGISELQATNLSLPEVKIFISNLIIKSSKVTFMLDDVSFTSTQPLKYLHCALGLLQESNTLPEDFKARVRKL